MNPRENVLTNDNAHTLTEVWASTSPGRYSEPIVADGRVYVTRATSGPGSGIWAQALDPTTGALLWERQLGTGFYNFVETAITRVGPDLVATWSFLGAAGCLGGTATLDPSDGTGPVTEGTVAWTPPVTSISTIVDRAVTVPGTSCNTIGHTVRVRDRASGAELWTTSPAGNTPMPPTALPTAAFGHVFVVAGSMLHAYPDGDCETPCPALWSKDFGVSVDAITPVVGFDGQVYVIARDGASVSDLVVVNVGDGTELWRADLDFTSAGIGGPLPTIAEAYGTVFVTTPGSGGGANQLYAFPATGCGSPTCAPRWTAAVTQPTSPTIAAGIVYVGTSSTVEGYDVNGCDLPPCAPLLSLPSAGGATHLSVASGTLFASGNGRVAAYRPSA